MTEAMEGGTATKRRGTFGVVLLLAAAAVPACVKIRRVVEAATILNNVDTASVFGTKRRED
ncbi:hypothetical protein [Arthrobacter mobilis]|uniref:Uncharacterized protein n=1 Tax=Arthrobacter mobilis TaxID=2724944 RepID=A0A7X6K6S6_9MICC|nr:hypothetical protein [Arthrobacter mobilis]NKX55880.1 hypothetical protein [Arthrobacter mobilis]